LTNTLTSLYKEDEYGTKHSIGDLLKDKAEKGVRVLLLFAENGKNDNETKKYFEGTSVKLALVGRDHFSHDQKSIVLDQPVSGNEKLQVTAFVGGLELTEGNWDTPKHSLYRSLGKEHKKDFYHPWEGVLHNWGPRQPWHDIHTKIEGPVAYDVRNNFEQRWKKQVAARVSELHPMDPSDFLQYPVDGSDEKPKHFKKAGNWTLQLFRSIDSNSAEGPSLEHSVQNGYINAISKAKRFIYIETGAFSGSEVPDAIAKRIANRVAKKRDFAVYVVLPLYPNADPSVLATANLIHNQYETISRVYKAVGKAISDNNIFGRHPSDYINFYSLANRETDQHSAAAYPHPGGAEASPASFLLDKSRRFPIHVHSNLMIVDDEYILVGSANIDERSMSGHKDTELTVGAYEESWLRLPTPRGHVHRFRLGLWGEHLHRALPEFLVPEDRDTIQNINRFADQNWEKFAGDSVVEMDTGHLIRFPIMVKEDGTIGPKVEFFPDTKAHVKGVARC